GYPRIALSDTVCLTSFLRSEFCNDDLDKMSPHLWIMSTQSSANISPLHRQKVKGREIIVTEDPRLHLIWIYDRVFVKPLPLYLTSHAFWDTYLTSATSPLGEERRRIRAAALGYLRTWVHLVRYESDFRIARDEKLCLIPGEVDWAKFCGFVARLESIMDSDVSDRYA